ncbi:ABC transporter permease [Christensenella intestinihominis]|uniref:ABC transporter permease n=1 Tax=Christensenella intestinihominis TaxID=1851429 RepID=UPI000834EEA5|nr:ABC transporter permease [Christensenella intestinihominis]
MSNEAKALKQQGGKKFDLQKLLTAGALIILFLFFFIYGVFGRNVNGATFISNILESAYFVGFLALGVTFAIITGGIDLSLGTVMMCGALVGGYAYNAWGWPLIGAMVLTVLIPVAFGLLNGILIARLRLPAFIATMGSMMIAQGLGSIITSVQTQRWPTAAETDGWFKTVFLKTESGFPTGIFWLVGFFLLAMFLLNKTKFGKYTFAIGSNEEAARLSGINTAKWLTLDYVVDGFFVGFAAIMYGATYTTVLPGTGNGLELQGIAAVVIGGTSLAGGVGSMSGTFIGVFIMAVLKTGLTSIGLQPQWQTFFVGVVVILAVLMDIYRQKSANKVKAA